ncbi:MAG: DUF2730 family protein [Alphaproteobacteria bacterium]
MTVDFGTLAQWATAALSLLAFGVSIAAMVNRQARALEDKVHNQGERLSNAEGQLRHLPTAESFASLRETVAMSNGEFVGMRAELRAVSKSIERMDNLMGQLVENELAGGRDAKRQTVERTST